MVLRTHTITSLQDGEETILLRNPLEIVVTEHPYEMVKVSCPRIEFAMIGWRYSIEETIRDYENWLVRFRRDVVMSSLKSSWDPVIVRQVAHALEEATPTV